MGICQGFSGWKGMILCKGNNRGKYLDVQKACQSVRSSSSSEWLVQNG